jgi:hypothetical protein
LATVADASAGALPVSPAGGGAPHRLRDDFVMALKANRLADRTVDAYCSGVEMLQNFLRCSPLRATVNDLRAFFFT